MPDMASQTDSYLAVCCRVDGNIPGNIAFVRWISDLKHQKRKAWSPRGYWETSRNNRLSDGMETPELLGDRCQNLTDKQDMTMTDQEIKRLAKFEQRDGRCLLPFENDGLLCRRFIARAAPWLF